MIVSSDADGVVKVWDVRMVAELGTIDCGQHPINKVGKYSALKSSKAFSTSFCNQFFTWSFLVALFFLIPC